MNQTMRTRVSEPLRLLADQGLRDAGYALLADRLPDLDHADARATLRSLENELQVVFNRQLQYRGAIDESNRRLRNLLRICRYSLHFSHLVQQLAASDCLAAGYLPDDRLFLILVRDGANSDDAAAAADALA